MPDERAYMVSDQEKETSKSDINDSNSAKECTISKKNTFEI